MTQHIFSISSLRFTHMSHVFVAGMEVEGKEVQLVIPFTVLDFFERLLGSHERILVENDSKNGLVEPFCLYVR